MSKNIELLGEQLDLPAGFDERGEMIPLRALLDSEKEPQDLSLATSEDQLQELTVARIQSQPDFKLASIGGAAVTGGVIDRERAIREVKNKTPLGLSLMDVEQRAIRISLEIASGEVRRQVDMAEELAAENAARVEQALSGVIATATGVGISQSRPREAVGRQGGGTIRRSRV